MAKLNPFFLETKYSFIRVIIIVLYVLATAMVLLGVVSLMAILKTPSPEEMVSDMMGFGRTITIVYCVMQFAAALGLLLYAQLLQVFIDLEWNQRETNALLEHIIKNQPELIEPAK